jgi:hypothetical protein
MNTLYYLFVKYIKLLFIENRGIPMKLTSKQLKRIIKEELSNVLEGQPIAGPSDLSTGEDELRKRYAELTAKAMQPGPLSSDENKEYWMIAQALDPAINSSPDVKSSSGAPGFYIELGDGLYNEAPYATEAEALEALKSLPDALQDEWPAPKVVKMD